METGIIAPILILVVMETVFRSCTAIRTKWLGFQIVWMLGFSGLALYLLRLPEGQDPAQNALSCFFIGQIFAPKSKLEKDQPGFFSLHLFGWNLRR